jgi:hypothetical protein
MDGSLSYSEVYMKALVVGVTTPKVAHEPGQFEVTVAYVTKTKVERVREDTGETWSEEFTKKKRKTVFSYGAPKLYSWIEVNLV